MMTEAEGISDRRSRGDAAPAHEIEAAIADNDARDLLVRRYLLGRLPDSHVEAFEERCVRDRTLLDELDATEPLVEGFRQIERDGRLRLLVGHDAVPRGFFAGRLSWTLALSAAAALVASVAVSIGNLGELHELQRE